MVAIFDTNIVVVAAAEKKRIEQAIVSVWMTSSLVAILEVHR